MRIFFLNRSIVLFMILALLVVACKPQGQEMDISSNREVEYQELKDEQDRLLKRITLDKESKQVIQVSNWQYDSEGNTLVHIDDFKESGKVYRNEYSYKDGKLQSISHYENDKRIAVEEFAGNRSKPTSVIQYENGDMVITNTIVYGEDGQWIYKEEINKIENTKEQQKRVANRIYIKKWHGGFLHQEQILNEHLRPIQIQPLVHGFHTVIAYHTYEKENKDAIKETRVVWHDDPSQTIDMVYPIKKENFGLQGDYLDAAKPELGIEVTYWKNMADIQVKKIEKRINRKGKEIW